MWGRLLDNWVCAMAFGLLLTPVLLLSLLIDAVRRWWNRKK